MITTMANSFDSALTDLGFSSFGESNRFDFALQRGDSGEIAVSLYRDCEENTLRISAYTSNAVPYSISRQFFSHFALAALEPFRDGIGIGMPENSDRICVFYSLPMKNYLPGNSVIVLEHLIEQVEKWDELLPYAAE